MPAAVELLVCEHRLGSDEWRHGLDPPDNPDGPPVARPSTWLLATGWRARGGGAIDTAEVAAA